MSERTRDVVGPIPAGRDPAEYDRVRRTALWMMQSGLYLISSAFEDQRNLMTANLVMQVATDPKIIGVSIEAEAVTRRLMDDSGVFAVVVLAKAQRVLVRRFVKPATYREGEDQLSSVEVEYHQVLGLPIPKEYLAAIFCSIIEKREFSSHVMYLAEVTDVSISETYSLESGILSMSDTRMHYGG